MKSKINLGKRVVGEGEPTYIIAELSANHNPDVEQAKKIIYAAKDAGADAIKLQTYTPDTITIRSNNEYFRITGGTIWDGRTLYDLYEEAYTPWDWQPALKQLANDLGMDLFSSAFDPSAVDFLDSINVPMHKIASPEIVDIPLIIKMAHTGKPLIISTGMATLAEIDEAVTAARSAGAEQIVLLKCTSAYPAPPEEMNLNTIHHLSDAFDVPVGLSDHTLGIAVPVAAVASGACVIEKHFALSRSIPGPDSAFSLEPLEFKAMVDAVRTVEKAMGQVHYGVSVQETVSRVFRRSLFVVKDIKAGDLFTQENVRSIRPAHGLHPRYFEYLIGKAASQDIPAGTPMKWDFITAVSKVDNGLDEV